MEGRTRYNYSSGTLTINAINYMIDILNSNKSDKEKAMILGDFCNLSSIIHSQSFYKIILMRKELFSYKFFNAVQKENILQKLELLEQFYNTHKESLNGIKNPYKCTTLEIQSRIRKLNAFNTIINSNLSDYQKVEAILKLFPDSETFRKSYSLFIKFGKDDKRLDNARDALNNFDYLLNKFIEFEQKGIVDDIKYYQSIENYIKDYHYAFFIVNYFVNTRDSYKTKEFFEKMGINNEIFNYCLEVIELLNEDLYHIYLVKENVNNHIRFMSNVKTIKNLAKGIETGFLTNGMPFNIMEFMKRIPFKGTNFFYTLDDFMKRNTPDEYNIIIKYILDNNLYHSSILKPLDIKALYTIKTTVNGVEITAKDVNIILDYLRVNDIPLIGVTYVYARAMYLKGEIDEEMVREQLRIKNLEKKITPGIKKYR